MNRKTRKIKHGGTTSEEERKKRWQTSSAKWSRSVSRQATPEWFRSVSRQATPELLEPVLNHVLETVSDSASLQNDYRQEPEHIPVLMNQGQEPICWAYSISIVLFRVFFRAIYLGYCDSNIRLGKSWLKNKNSYLIFNNNSESSLISIINFIQSIRAIIDSILNPKNQSLNFSKKIIIYSEKYFTINIKLNELRQCIVLSYIFLLLIGIELNYKNYDNMYDEYKFIFNGNGRNSIETIQTFIDDIKNYSQREIITKFMTKHWFTPYSNNILLGFLHNLDFRPKKLGVSIKSNDPRIKFINYSYDFVFNDPSSNIDKFIYNIKLLFKEARKCRVYILISCNITDLIPGYVINDSIDHTRHAVYAIPHPENKNQFIIKNSWGDEYNNIIVSFDDLRNWTRIKIYVCYLNYFNYSEKTRINPDVIFRDVASK